MTLKEIIKDLTQEQQDQINNAVDSIKAKAIKDKDIEIIKLQEANKQLLETANKNNIDSVVKELIGDNEIKSKLLIKLTNLTDTTDKNKIKDAFKETMKEYKDVFEVKKEEPKKETQEPTFNVNDIDTSFDNLQFKQDKQEQTKEVDPIFDNDNLGEANL